MPNNAPLILLTRPSVLSGKFRALLPNNSKVIISPVIKIEFSKFDIEPDDYEIFIFTSGNGVIAASRCIGLVGRKAFVVGENTATEAESREMNIVAVSASSNDLIEQFDRVRPRGKLLFVRGAYSTGDIVNSLKSLGLEANSIVAYDQRPVPISSDAKIVLNGEIPLILPLFSPRSARLLSNEVAKTRVVAKLCLIGLSRNVLKEWKGPPADKICVALQPNGTAMAKEIVRQHAMWP